MTKERQPGTKVSSGIFVPENKGSHIRLKRRIRAKQRTMMWWRELSLLLFVALGIAVALRTFAFQVFYIPSTSMEQTLLIGDRVVVNKLVYHFSEPKRGEVIVFRGTDKWAPEVVPVRSTSLFERIGRGFGDLLGLSEPDEKDFIKRIIGVSGDTVACCDNNGRITVNNRPFDEPYITNNAPLEEPLPGRECRSRIFGPVTIPPGYLFVLGDHRLVSQDSRCRGLVPTNSIIGRASLIVWPVGRWDSVAFVEATRPASDQASRVELTVTGTIAGSVALFIPLRVVSLLMAHHRRRRLPW